MLGLWKVAKYMAFECMGSVRIFPPALLIVASGEKSKRSGWCVQCSLRHRGSEVR